ncbi:MAG: TonB-dependent receptor [Ignavibacteriae bacterium]|nr:TonB-dependent receptor [Ignavibacteriota bacterium]
MLNSQAGFYISNDRNYNYLGVRGFSRPTDYNNRILVLIDGHRINEYVYDSALLGDQLGLSLDNFEKVEISRGPGSALYGTSAMFAVINLISKKVRNILNPSIKLGYGTFNTKSISLNGGHQFDDDISLSINGSYAESDGEDLYFSEFDDPETNNGLAVGKDFMNRHGLMGSISYKNFKLQGISTYSKDAVPTASWEADFNKNLVTIEELHFIEVSYFQNISYNSQFSIRAYFDKYYCWGVYPYNGEDSFEKNDAETFGTEAKFIWDVLPNNRITAGVEYKNILRADYKYWDDYTIYNEFDVPYEMLSVYLQDEFQLNSQLSLYIGLRNDSYINTVSSLSPRFGIVYNPWSDHTIKLLYGKAFRAPNAYEQKYEDPLYGFKVNPNGLLPENAYTSEFIWDYKISNILSINTSIYYYRITDLLDQVEDPEDEFYHFANFGEIEAFGTELNLDAKFSKSSGAYLRYSYQNAKDEYSNTLSNSPSQLIKFGVFYKIFAPLNASFEYKYGSERLTVYETETDPIHLVRLSLHTDPILDKVKLSFLIRNLFNNTIKYPGGWEHHQPSIIQPGRNFTFSIKYGI